MGSRFAAICVAVLISLMTVEYTSREAMAKSEFFSQKCAGCHSNDTATCNGCHAHGVWQDSSRSAKNLTATTDLDLYQPGQTVTVTFSGGYRQGWIRAILYDENGLEVDRVTGPTGMGDDGSGSADQQFPVMLSAPAPGDAGFYTWSASWFGSPYDTNNSTVFPHVQENVLTNEFEVYLPPTDLTRINLVAPANQAALSAPPTFSWQGDGGARNAYAVDISASPSFTTFYSTYENLHLTISAVNWTLPAAVWNKVPAGASLYWRVRGVDLNENPLTIIASDEVWTFTKQ